MDSAHEGFDYSIQFPSLEGLCNEVLLSCWSNVACRFKYRDWLPAFDTLLQLDKALLLAGGESF